MRRVAVVSGFLVLAAGLSRPGAEARPEAPAFDVHAAVERAAGRAGAVVPLPPGVHRLDRRLEIRGARGLVIEGRGAMLVFSDVRNGGVHVADSQGVVLRGLAIDYDPLPFTQGRVVAVGPGPSYYDVELDAGYVADLGRFPVSTERGDSVQFKVFDPATRRFKVDGMGMAVRRLEAVRPGVIRAFIPEEASPKTWFNWAPGDPVALISTWYGSAVEIWHSAGTVVDGVTILSAPGGGIKEFGGDGGSRMRYAIRRGPRPPGATADRLLATNRDGLNSTGTKAGPRVERCTSEFLGDDHVNVNGLFAFVRSVRERTLELRGPCFAPPAGGSRGTRSGTPTGSSRSGRAPSTGSRRPPPSSSGSRRTSS